MARPVAIEDEFTRLPVSRQRKLQLRNRKKGLCQCGKAVDLPRSGSMCAGCLALNKARAKKRRLAKPRKRRPKHYKTTPKPVVLCLFCQSVAFSRGLCQKHYAKFDYLCKTSHTTWPDLIQQGMANPSKYPNQKTNREKIAIDGPPTKS